MNITLLLLLAVLMSSCVSRQVAAPTPLEPTNATHESVVTTFTGCVSPVGPQRELPVAATAPAGADVLLLSTPGIVADGYYHWLHIQRGTGLVFIVQIGGIAGRQTVFGPFEKEYGCLAVPPRLTPPGLMKLARHEPVRKAMSNRPLDRAGMNAVCQVECASAGRSTPLR